MLARLDSRYGKPNVALLKQLKTCSAGGGVVSYVFMIVKSDNLI